MKTEDILLHPHDHKRKGDWLGILGFMDKNLDYKNINNALDLGGGRGDISYRILENNGEARAVCVDVEADLLETAGKRHPNLQALSYDINKKLPFEDASMDFVSCLGTLHYPYIYAPKEVFADMARVSKKYIMVDFLYKYRFWYFLLKLRHPNYKPRFWTRQEIYDLIKKHNLSVVDSFGTRNPFGKLFPSMGRTTIFLLEKNTP